MVLQTSHRNRRCGGGRTGGGATGGGATGQEEVPQDRRRPHRPVERIRMEVLGGVQRWDRSWIFHTFIDTLVLRLTLCMFPRGPDHLSMTVIDHCCRS